MLRASPNDPGLMAPLTHRLLTPPPTSPSAVPCLGLALALNVLLAAGLHLGMTFGAGVEKDVFFVDLMKHAPIIYLVMLLPTVAMYGLAAAAWTGWSWWRVPIATLAGAALSLGVNAWAMSKWMAFQRWDVNPLLSAGDPRITSLMVLAGLSFIALGVIGFSMWGRWQSIEPNQSV